MDKDSQNLEHQISAGSPDRYCLPCGKRRDHRLHHRTHSLKISGVGLDQGNADSFDVSSLAPNHLRQLYATTLSSDRVMNRFILFPQLVSHKTADGRRTSRFLTCDGGEKHNTEVSIQYTNPQTVLHDYLNKRRSCCATHHTRCLPLREVTSDIGCIMRAPISTKIACRCYRTVDDRPGTRRSCFAALLPPASATE